MLGGQWGDEGKGSLSVYYLFHPQTTYTIGKIRGGQSMMMMISKTLFRGHSKRCYLSTFAGIPSDDNRVTAVLGGQWGDEGKGKFYRIERFSIRRRCYTLIHSYIWKA